MEEYEDVGSNALITYNATDATDATTGGQKLEAGRQNLQFMGQSELETEENDLGNPVLEFRVMLWLKLRWVWPVRSCT